MCFNPGVVNTMPVAGHCVIVILIQGTVAADGGPVNITYCTALPPGAPTTVVPTVPPLYGDTVKAGTNAIDDGTVAGANAGAGVAQATGAGVHVPACNGRFVTPL